MILWLAACTPDPVAPVDPKPPSPEPIIEDTAPVDTDTTTETTGVTGDTGPEPPTSVLQFAGEPPTNLIIVSLDTTRRDFIGRFALNGNTPNLDARMEEGVPLENHRSCSSWTGPSMTCVVTGRTPFDLNWFPWTGDYDVSGWDDDLPTLAGQLYAQKGFNTTLVTANGVMGPYLPLDRGFEIVQNLDYQPATVVTDAALAELSALTSAPEPFYLHVHYMDPHEPYCPPEEYIEFPPYADIGEDLCNDFWGATYGLGYHGEGWQDQFLTNAMEIYDAELDYWDVEFGRFWEEADASGALDNTLVVFVTDHGEQFYERGGFGHGNTLAAEENRSTAMFWSKEIVPQVWTEPTVHEDIGTTLMNYFETTPPEPLTGTDVGLAPSDRFIRGMLYWGCCGAAQLSVVRGDLQLTYDFWGEKHLWDYSLDPTGMTDYYDPVDPDVLALWVEMSAYVDEVLTQWPSSGPASYVGP